MTSKVLSADEFDMAYREGLSAFIAAIKRTKPGDEKAFKPILRNALERFGITATSLAERVDHSKGTVSKWVNTDAMPSQSTREIAQAFILEQLQRQFDDIESRPYEKIAA